MQLKSEVGNLRNSIVRQKQDAEQRMLEQKSIDAKEERKRQKQQEYLVKKLKEIDVKANRKRAEKIKEF